MSPESMPRTQPGVVRLADLLCGLSQVSDLAMANPPEEALRSTLVASGLARHLGVPDTQAGEVFYTALLQHVGCTAFAHETAALLGGDDRVVNQAGVRTDPADFKDGLTTFLPELTRGTGVFRRLRLVTAAMVRGAQVSAGSYRANCEVAAMVADRLGLGPGVQAGLLQIFEWWNGRGGPAGVAGDEVALPSRITNVASVAVLFHGLGGQDLAVEAVRRRAGGCLDPGIVSMFERVGPDLLAEAANADAAAAVLEAEPRPVELVPSPRLPDVARAFGEMVDLKSPFLHGHASGVAELAQAAGTSLHLDEAAGDALRVAGLLHDVGRVSVASGIWDKPGPLTSAERDQVELHAYHSERILRRSATLAPLAELAGLHHERCDGTGYHRRLSSAGVPMAARVLGAADTFVAMTQARPYRPGLPPDRAADQLIGEAKARHLDNDAVEAVLTAAGHRPRHVARSWPAGLTDRQAEVLRLLAAGCSNREIARRLVVSPRTAEHHVQAIYAKIGVSSRAAAAMFAMHHDLLG